MTQGIAYALAAMVFYGLADLVYKRAAIVGIPAHHFMMVQTWFFLSFCTLYGLVSGSLVFTSASLWGLAAGVFAFTGFYNFAQSLRGGSVSINAPIFRLSFTVTAALAVVFLGEPLNAYKAAGIGLALLAVWLLLAADAASSPAARHVASASLARVLVATVAVGVANLLYKVGLRAGATPASLLVVQASLVVMMSTSLAASIDRGIRPVRTTWRFAIAASMLLSTAFITLLEGLARGEASVLVPVAQMGFVVTAAVGFLFLRERFTPRKGAGLLIALAALASLARA
jgi:drug/metabolite transporter (DMT)-like permease